MKRKIVIGIYKISSPSKKIYIGQSKDIYKTWQMRYENCNCPNQPHLYNSIKKHGWNAHGKEIIHQIPVYDVSELNKLEEYYGDLYNCNSPIYGLNIRKCGGSRGEHSPESNEKNRQKHLGKKASPKTIELMSRRTGIKNPFFGKKHTNESNELNRLAHLGKKHKEESIAPMCKILLNTATGIYYIGLRSAAESIGLKYVTLAAKMNGRVRNNTSFIRV